MTRFLDRGPQVGDRVHVEYEATVVKQDDDCWGLISVLPGYHLRTETVDTSTVRVIAPEPMVGDVVTADMDLPEGSIIEGENNGVLARRFPQCWNVLGREQPSTTAALLARTPTHHWRIVRIGGAPS
jgi:hypothetical protein